MRALLAGSLAAAVLLIGVSASADEPAEPQVEDISVEDALAEPADADDAADIRADNDPDDVGQEALLPPEDADTDSEATAPPATADPESD